MSPREMRLRAKLAWLGDLEAALPPATSDGTSEGVEPGPLQAALLASLTSAPPPKMTALPQERQDEASAASVAPKLLQVAPTGA